VNHRGQEGQEEVNHRGQEGQEDGFGGGIDNVLSQSVKFIETSRNKISVLSVYSVVIIIVRRRM
ncbi:MAG: hypothetical protein KFH87_00575, partial [Bacteroidetes bacterium]|nr:hypothetical protein [Bacteroidota bacterium]